MKPTRFAILLAFAFVATMPTLRAKAPNVVLINADDLGYGDLGCYGATKVRTPHIDRLAAEGRRFTDAHSPSAVCSPSRYGLMTGQFPLRRNFWGPTSHFQELTIDPAQPTLASTLKSAGYATAVIGKWHLGFGTGKTDWNKPLKPGPLELGFDYYFGMPTVNSGGPFVYVENHDVVDYDPQDPFVPRGKKKSLTENWPAKGRGPFGGADKAQLRYRDAYVGTEFAQRAVKWIGERAADAESPFFLYLATTNIHHPFTPHPRFKNTSDCGLYGDFIHELDWIVGEVLAALDKHEIADNTLVIFTSDNGGMLNEGGQDAWKAGHRLNGELQGFKFGAWEGGHRVPFIARWPGSIPAGTTSKALVSQVDLLATFAAVSGATLPQAAQVDSVNQLPEFLGKATEAARELLVISPNSPKHLTIRRGDWVYIPSQDEGGFQGKNLGNHVLGGAATQPLTKLVNSDVVDGKIRKDAPPAQLYNLAKDPRQASNVYTEHPELVAEFGKLLDTWREKIPATQRVGWINLKQSDPNAAATKAPGAAPGPKSTKGAAPKIPAIPSTRSASFDFESGKLSPWKIVEGNFAHVIGQKETFFRSTEAYNKQGRYYLTTLEPSPTADRGADEQTGVIVSPLFIAKAGKMTFRVGGGNSANTYVALCTADGKEVRMARGVNNQVMQQASWDLTPFAGQKTFIKVVDKSSVGWGHVTVDNFQFDAEVLTEYPQ